jgi:hypothetical protein
MGYSPNNRKKIKYNKLLFIHTTTATGSDILIHDVCLEWFNLVKDRRFLRNAGNHTQGQAGHSLEHQKVDSELIKSVKLQYKQYYWRFQSVLLLLVTDYKPVRYKVKVKVDRLHGNQANRGGKCVALATLKLGTRSGWVISATPTALSTGKWPSIHFTESRVGLGESGDGFEKSRPHCGTNPGFSSS